MVDSTSKRPISVNLRQDGAPKAGLYPDLALVVESWPDLPEHIRAAVLALVRSQDSPGSCSGGESPLTYAEDHQGSKEEDIGKGSSQGQIRRLGRALSQAGQSGPTVHGRHAVAGDRQCEGTEGSMETGAEGPIVDPAVPGLVHASRVVDGFQTCATIRTLCENREKFAGFLELHAQAGLIVYLSDAEKEAAERLIFTQQHRQDRDNTETADSTDSGVVLSESTSPDCMVTTGQKSQNTGQQSESHGTAEAPGTAQQQGKVTPQGEHQAQGQQPVNPQKPEAAASERRPEGPTIDAPRRPAHSLSEGLIACTPPNRTRGRAVPDEPSLLGDSLHLWRDDPLSLSFGCEMHNELHKGSCLYPGTREQRAQWSTEIWSDVTCWAKLCFEHIRGRPDAAEMCQKMFGYAHEQVKYHKSARKPAAVTMSIAKKALGIDGHPARAGP
jgi:hypothetical protein